MSKAAAFILILTAFLIDLSAEDLTFRQFPDIVNSRYTAENQNGSHSYRIRLTDLQSGYHSGLVEEMPLWGEWNEPFGGLFQKAHRVDAIGYYDYWGHEGYASKGVSSRDIELPEGPEWDNFLANDFFFIDEEISGSFEFRKFINGESVAISNFLMADLDLLDDGYFLARWNRRQADPNMVNLHLFIPFRIDESGRTVPYEITVGGSYVSVPHDVQYSSNFSSAPELDSASEEFQKWTPGVVIVFHTISDNVPHIIMENGYPRSVGDGMSSFINKEIFDKNVSAWSSWSTPHAIPPADWGYQGYFYGFLENSFKNLTSPYLNVFTGTNSLGEWVGITSRDLRVLDGRVRPPGNVPLRLMEGYEPFLYDDYIVRIDGEIVDFRNPGLDGYDGSNLVYTAIYIARNPEVTHATRTNWRTGETFELTVERKQ